jgi:thiol peroxidase
MDLPFAQKRWCAAEGVEKLIVASDYKHRSVGQAFGAFIKDWGLTSRAVFVIDSQGKIAYTQYVPEVSAEPDYASVLDAVKALA